MCELSLKKIDIHLIEGKKPLNLLTHPPILQNISPTLQITPVCTAKVCYQNLCCHFCAIRMDFQLVTTLSGAHKCTEFAKEINIKEYLLKVSVCYSNEGGDPFSIHIKKMLEIINQHISNVLGTCSNIRVTVRYGCMME